MKRFYISEVMDRDISSLYDRISEELKILQDDGNEIIDVHITPSYKVGDSTYYPSAIIKYIYEEKEVEPIERFEEGTKKYYDALIERFERIQNEYFIRLSEYLETFTPLSNDEEEENLEGIVEEEILEQ